MINFFKTSLQEISQSSELRIYGFFLSLSHLVTFFWWQSKNFFVANQSPLNSEPLCYSFFKDCDLFRQLFSEFHWQIMLYLYLGLAVINVFLFFEKRKLKFALITLGFITLTKLLFCLTNYGLDNFYHWILLIASIVYLFFPGKIYTLKYFIVLTSFFIGLNLMEGTSQIIFSRVWMKVYIIFLHSLAIFSVLINKPWLRKIILIQFFGFFCFLFFKESFFSSLMSLSLFSLLFIKELLNANPVESHKNPLKKKNRFIITLFLVSFFITQSQAHLIPFYYNKRTHLWMAITFDPPPILCEHRLIAHKKEQSVIISQPLKNLGNRFHCDPMVLLNQAYQLCRQNKKRQQFEKLSLSFDTRRPHQSFYQSILKIEDICAHKNPLSLSNTKRTGERK